MLLNVNFSVVVINMFCDTIRRNNEDFLACLNSVLIDISGRLQEFVSHVL